MKFSSRAAQQALIGRQVSRILEGRRGVRGPGLAVVIPGGFDPVDTRLLDIAVLALEGHRVEHDELDQLVDLVAKGRQRERLAVADLLPVTDLVAPRFLGIQIRICRRIRRDRSRRARGRPCRPTPSRARFADREAVLRIPGRVAAESLVIGIRGASSRRCAAERRLVLEIELARRRVGAVGQSKDSASASSSCHRRPAVSVLLSDSAMSFCQSRLQRRVCAKSSRRSGRKRIAGSGRSHRSRSRP